MSYHIQSSSRAWTFSPSSRQEGDWSLSFACVCLLGILCLFLVKPCASWLVLLLLKGPTDLQHTPWPTQRASGHIWVSGLYRGEQTVPTLLLARCEIRAYFQERGCCGLAWSRVLGSRSSLLLLMPRVKTKHHVCEKRRGHCTFPKYHHSWVPPTPEPALGLLIQLTVAQRLTSLPAVYGEWGLCGISSAPRAEPSKA